MLDITIVPPRALAQVRAFYEQVGYGGGATEKDRVLVARIGESLVGAVRLCQEHGVTVLRGMHIAPACQHQGIGRALLARCVPWLEGGEAFCLPYAHLVGFYREAGFEPLPKAALPPFLRARLEGYLGTGQQVLAMRRPAA